MKTTSRERAEAIARLVKLGVSRRDAEQLRRIATTLRRWFEYECGTAGSMGQALSIERNEHGEGRPFLRIQYRAAAGNWVDVREAGAKRRLAKIMAPMKRRLEAYIQGDCRGPALYILRKSDVKPGESLSSVYPRGVAVY